MRDYTWWARCVACGDTWPGTKRHHNDRCMKYSCGSTTRPLTDGEMAAAMVGGWLAVQALPLGLST